MSELIGQSPLRRLVLYRSVEVLVLIGILAGCFVAYAKTEESRAEARAAQIRLANYPQYLLGLSSVQQELRGRSHDLDRILGFIGSSDHIIDFIEELEGLAADSKVELEVPSIGEVKEVDESGQPIEPRGPFRLISLTIDAQGRAENLLQYLHDVEHTSHLVSLEDWQIQTEQSASSAPTNGSLGAREIGEKTSVVPEVASSRLRTKLILVVHNEKYSP